jgi:hypothetical protein
MMFVEAYSQDEFLEAAKDASDFFIALDDAYEIIRVRYSPEFLNAPLNIHSNRTWTAAETFGMPVLVRQYDKSSTLYVYIPQRYADNPDPYVGLLLRFAATVLLPGFERELAKSVVVQQKGSSAMFGWALDKDNKGVFARVLFKGMFPLPITERFECEHIKLSSDNSLVFFTADRAFIVELEKRMLHETHLISLCDIEDLDYVGKVVEAIKNQQDRR